MAFEATGWRSMRQNWVLLEACAVRYDLPVSTELPNSDRSGAPVPEVVKRPRSAAKGGEMFRTTPSASARTARFLVAAMAVASLVLTTHAAPAQTMDDCYIVADNQQENEDTLTHITPEQGTTTPIPETIVGDTGTFGIESLAVERSDPNFTVWAADKDQLGTLDKSTAAFTPTSKKFGSGNGALGTQSFDNVDGLAFVGDKLYGTQRDEEDPDLFFEIDPATGERVKDAFGANKDYHVIPAPNGTDSEPNHNADALEADSDDSTLFVILNERGGSDSLLATIDPSTGSVSVRGSTHPADDIEGMAFGLNGHLWYLNGKDFNGDSDGDTSYVWEADKASGTGSNPRPVGADDGLYDYEGFVCRMFIPPPGLQAFKYDDRNGNGLRDGPQEPPLGGWVFHLIGADGSHQHATTLANGIADFGTIPPGRYLVCEELQPGWSQTAPRSTDQFVADCSGHTHGGTITPGPRGYEFNFPTDAISQPLEFGNSRCVETPAVSSNARAFGLRADLLGGAVLPGTPDIGPMPDSDVMNPDALIAVSNVLDSTAPPLVSLLSVSEEQTPISATATATTAAVDIKIPGLDALRVQADAVKSQSRSYLEVGGASSSSAGSTIANLRIGGTQYGDVSEPLTVVINDPLNPGTPFIEVHVIERVRRDAAAGIVQPFPGQSKSGLDVNGIHIVVHDLALTPINEASDIIVAHASTDIAFTAVRACPSVSGRAFSAQLLNVKPDLANAIVGEVILPSTGGEDAEHLADVDVGTVLTADASSTSTKGAVTLGPDGATAESRAQVAHATLSTLLEATLIQSDASATLNPDGTTTTSGDTIIADVRLLGTDVCGALGLTSTCHPAPNTEPLPANPLIKVILNEQIPDADGKGLTVNAIHIWVLGSIPGSTLPIGAEVIISSAHADAHCAVGDPRPTCD